MTPRETDVKLNLARQQVEERLDDLRQSAARQFGSLPRVGVMLLPLAALAVGLVLGMKARGRRRKRVRGA